MKAKRVKGLDPEASLVENAARIVKVRLAELHSFSPAALEPDGSTEQHDMRIAAKRLRYILEATDFCFGKPAQTARRKARELQGILGELHDCDVMLPRIESHLASLRNADARAVHARAGDAPDLDPRLSARAPHRTAYRGLGMLAVHVEARRRVLFDRFRAYWSEQERIGTWDRLEHAVERKLAEAKERRAAAERAAQAARELEEAERAEREAAERAREAAAKLHQARQVVRGDGGSPPAPVASAQEPPEASETAGSPSSEDG
jgi:DNA repair exonuclease SbcCD ATPase subunit